MVSFRNQVSQVSRDSEDTPITPRPEKEEYDDIDEEDLDRRKAAQRRIVMRRPTLADCMMVMDEMTVPKDPFPDHLWFCCLVCIEVIANLVVFGMEADYRCRTNCKESDFAIWDLLDHAMTGLAVVEVLVAIVGYGPRMYFKGDPRAHKRCEGIRIFDFTLVVLRVFDVWILRPAGMRADLRYFTVLRVWHLARLADQVKHIHGFQNLVWIIAGMRSCLRSVLMVSVVLAVMSWILALVVTIRAGRGALPASAVDFTKSSWDKDVYWGTVPASMYTLFQILTRDGWGMYIVWPLVDYDPGLIVLFIFFLIFANIGLVNCIVGCVVGSIIRGGKQMEESLRSEKELHEEKILRVLEGVVMDAVEAERRIKGDSARGTLTRKSLHRALVSTGMDQKLRMLDITRSDIDLLFTLLDEESTGTLKSSMFFGCAAKLRGDAMSRDAQNLLIDIKKGAKWLDTTDEKMDFMNETLESLLGQLDAIDRDIIQDEDDIKDPVLMARKGRKTVTGTGGKMTPATSQMTAQKSDLSKNGRDKVASNPSKSVLKTALKFRFNLCDHVEDMEADENDFNPLAPPPPPALPAHIADLSLEDAKRP